jgi:hypothetical protein
MLIFKLNIDFFQNIAYKNVYNVYFILDIRVCSVYNIIVRRISE